jgi:hypothetical protein
VILRCLQSLRVQGCRARLARDCDLIVPERLLISCSSWPAQVLRVLRVAWRIRFHREGELRDRDRHPESLPGAWQLPLLRSFVQDTRRALRAAREQAQLGLVQQRSGTGAHGNGRPVVASINAVLPCYSTLVAFGVRAGELGDLGGDRRHGRPNARRGRPPVVPGAGAADQGHRAAVRKRDLRRGPAAAAVVGRRPRVSGRRRGAPDHPARAAEHQHVRRGRPRARRVPGQVGRGPAAACAGGVRGGAASRRDGAGAALAPARADQAGPTGGREGRGVRREDGDRGRGSAAAAEDHAILRWRAYRRR